MKLVQRVNCDVIAQVEKVINILFKHAHVKDTHLYRIWHTLPLIGGCGNLWQIFVSKKISFTKINKWS